jgi:hypothetical protein
MSAKPALSPIVVSVKYHRHSPPLPTPTPTLLPPHTGLQSQIDTLFIIFDTPEYMSAVAENPIVVEFITKNG